MVTQTPFLPATAAEKRLGSLPLGSTRFKAAAHALLAELTWNLSPLGTIIRFTCGLHFALSHRFYLLCVLVPDRRKKQNVVKKAI